MNLLKCLFLLPNFIRSKCMSLRKLYFRHDFDYFPSNQNKNVVSFTEKCCTLISRNIFVEGKLKMSYYDLSKIFRQYV